MPPPTRSAKFLHYGFRMSNFYSNKITETIDLSSPSFLDASVKPFYKHYLQYINFSLLVDVYKCKKMCIYKHFNNMHTMNIINFKGGSGEPPLDYQIADDAPFTSTEGSGCDC